MNAAPKKNKQSNQLEGPAGSAQLQIQRIDSQSSTSSQQNYDSSAGIVLPSNKTQTQTTPMPSLSPVLSHSPAQSARASPQNSGAKIIQTAAQSQVLGQNQSWLAQASERIEKTIELINIKKIKEALHILLEINQVFESSGICVSSSNNGIDSTKSTSPIPGKTPNDMSGRRNKTSVQLAIITKYNLACCFQSLGESQKCIKYLQQASQQLSYYSNMEDTPQGLFKMKGFTDRTASGAKKDSTTAITPEGAVNLDFNEYNCVGASSAKDGNESTFDRQQAHDQLSAQLQANRYLCKFHLQLCAIMSQLGQHVQANENGQKAAAIAEIILIKTHEFCQMSIDELMARDAGNVPNSKVKSSIIDHTVTDTQGNDSRDDYQGGNASLKSSMMKQNQVRKMTRGNSVTSLYSQEKERKSVSIRRSRSKTNSMQGRASSMAGNSDDTTQSLERMYTFNLSQMQKQVNAKNKGAKKDSPAGVPAGEDAIDIRPVDMKTKNEEGDGADEGKNSPDRAGVDSTNADKTSSTLPVLGISKTASSENPEEETKGRQTERTRSQVSRSMPQNQANFCPTYQVLERTNIQEKQIINVQPLLDEFRHVSEEFKQKDLTMDEAENHNKLAQFTSVREIQALKSNKRFKINVRNTLGVKDHNNWIYNLNIGNVMNLTPMNSDELNTQSDVFQELSKDTMLEKFILYVVAYFCVGTEIRFQATKMEKKESPQEYIKVWSSEMWHGKSLQVACIFLPEDCPLVDHIIKSYKKHYIGKSSLLSVVIQPKPRGGRPNVPLTSSRSQPMQPEQKPTSMMNMERPSSQQQLSPPLAELQAEKLRLFQKSPAGANNNRDNAAVGGGTTASNHKASNSKDQALNHQTQPQQTANGHNLLHVGSNNSGNPNGGSAPNATENNMSATVGNPTNYATQQPQKSSSAQSKRKTPVMIGGAAGGFQKQIGGITQQKNSKQRTMTLKDMVFQNLNPTASAGGNTSGNNDQAQASTANSNPSAVTIAQSHKIPVRSSETPSGSEPEDENQEAVVIFKGLRKFSRNKPGTADSQEDGENGTGGYDSKEDQNNSVENGKASEPQQSPVVRRRAVLPAAQQQQQPQQQLLQEQHQQLNDQPTKKSRQNAQTISYNDLARLQQNLNNQIQHNKQIASIRAQKSQEPGLPEPDSNSKKQILALGERPQSAQQISSVEGASSSTNGAQQISQGSSQKHVENLTNNISSGTPKRSGQVSHSHKRYHQGPSITASLTKVLSKPGAKGQSKVLQSEVLLNPQAWPTVANSASSKPQNKQKVIMLNKQKQKIINQPGGAHGQTALWLANNPASDKLQSKHPIQIGTTKFVDNQLKMLSENSNQNTARGAKKHSMGLQDAAQSVKKEAGAGGVLIEQLRKKPISDLHRAYDSNNLHSVAVAAQTAGGGNLTLSKSITKEKFHQLSSHQGAGGAASILTAGGPVGQQRGSQMHHPLSNKLASAAGHHQTHTLKKSASTRQVVNLLDLKQIQQTHIYGGSSKQGLLAKHVGGIHHQIGSAGKQGVVSSVKSGPAAGQVQSQNSNQVVSSGGHAGANQQSSQVQPGFKTLSKKHKNVSECTRRFM